MSSITTLKPAPARRRQANRETKPTGALSAVPKDVSAPKAEPETYSPPTISDICEMLKGLNGGYHEVVASFIAAMKIQDEAVTPVEHLLYMLTVIYGCFEHPNRLHCGADEPFGMTPVHVRETVATFEEHFKTMMANRAYILDHYPDVPEAQQAVPQAA